MTRFCSRYIDIFIPGTQRADDVEFRECCEALRPVEPLVRTVRMRSPSCSNLHAIRRCGGMVYFKARGRKPGRCSDASSIVTRKGRHNGAFVYSTDFKGRVNAFRNLREIYSLRMIRMLHKSMRRPGAVARQLCDKKSGEIKQMNQHRANQQPTGKREIKDAFIVTFAFHDATSNTTNALTSSAMKTSVSGWLTAIIFRATNRSRVEAMVKSLIFRVKATF